MMALLDYLDELELGLGLDLEVTLTDESPSCAFFTRADLEAVEVLDVDQVAVSIAEFEDVELDDDLRDAAVDSLETLRRLIADLTDAEVLVVAIV